MCPLAFDQSCCVQIGKKVVQGLLADHGKDRILDDLIWVGDDRFRQGAQQPRFVGDARLFLAQGFFNTPFSLDTDMVDHLHEEFDQRIGHFLLPQKAEGCE